jgi:hypothetical protein
VAKVGSGTGPERGRQPSCRVRMPPWWRRQVRLATRNAPPTASLAFGRQPTKSIRKRRRARSMAPRPSPSSKDLIERWARPPLRTWTREPVPAPRRLRPSAEGRQCRVALRRIRTSEATRSAEAWRPRRPDRSREAAARSRRANRLPARDLRGPRYGDQHRLWVERSSPASRRPGGGGLIPTDHLPFRWPRSGGSPLTSTRAGRLSSAKSRKIGASKVVSDQESAGGRNGPVGVGRRPAPRGRHLVAISSPPRRRQPPTPTAAAHADGSRPRRRQVGPPTAGQAHADQTHPCSPREGRAVQGFTGNSPRPCR